MPPTEMKPAPWELTPKFEGPNEEAPYKVSWETQGSGNYCDWTRGHERYYRTLDEAKAAASMRVPGWTRFLRLTVEEWQTDLGGWWKTVLKRKVKEDLKPVEYWKQKKEREQVQTNLIIERQEKERERDRQRRMQIIVWGPTYSIREKLKAARARWNPEKKYWAIPVAAYRELQRDPEVAEVFRRCQTEEFVPNAGGKKRHSGVDGLAADVRRMLNKKR
jgi:hypothetical protein